VTTSPAAFAIRGTKLSTTIPWGEARYVGRAIAAHHKLPRVVPRGEKRGLRGVKQRHSRLSRGERPAYADVGLSALETTHMIAKCTATLDGERPCVRPTHLA
jgi:hypothetical protein